MILIADNNYSDRRQNARGVNPAGGDGSESGLVSKEAREQLVGFTTLLSHIL